MNEKKRSKRVTSTKLITRSYNNKGYGHSCVLQLLIDDMEQSYKTCTPKVEISKEEAVIKKIGHICLPLPLGTTKTPTFLTICFKLEHLPPPPLRL